MISETELNLLITEIGKYTYKSKKGEFNRLFSKIYIHVVVLHHVQKICEYLYLYLYSLLILNWSTIIITYYLILKSFSVCLGALARGFVCHRQMN